MNNSFVLWLLIQILIFNAGVFVLLNKPDRKINIVPPRIIEQPLPEPEIESPNPVISNSKPDYQNYSETVRQLKEWHEEAPRLTDIGTYGYSSQGKELYYIKIHSVGEEKDKPVVLITACIHGNEPLSASTTMNYIGAMLEEYGENEKITQLINSRDIYFVPIVSPDSYPYRRHVDGVDPNRDFPSIRNSNKKSVPPVLALQKFFLELKPNAVISGHTHGRVYLTPWGDQRKSCPNESDYQRVMSKMGYLSQYKVIRASQMYGNPIYGTEVDWYYRNGAFAIVMEFGTHQRIPSRRDIDQEFNQTFNAVLHFIKEAPLVDIKSDWMSYWSDPQAA